MPATAIHSLDELLASEQVPSLPEVALRVIQIAQQPDPDVQELIRTIRMDAAIAGRVLKFANSALFGLRSRPSSIEAAVPMLGTTLVRTLVLGFTLARQTKASEAYQPWFRQLWRETLFQAAAAEYLAEKSGKADAPTWFLGGLLQDVGQLALLNAFESEYVDRVLEVADARSRAERERDSFGFTHVDISVALCRRWNLEQTLIESIESHHRLPSLLTMDHRAQMSFGLAAASCCSEYMDAISERLTAARTDVERCLIEVCGVLPQDVFPVLAEMDVRSAELAGGFSVDIGNVPSRERLLAMAQAVLREIAMERQLRGVDRKAVPVAAVNEKDSHSEFDRSNWSEWFHGDSDVYNDQYAKHAVPRELAANHANGLSLGLMEVRLHERTVAEHSEKEFERIVRILKDAVRPADQVARINDRTFLVIMPGLNHDLVRRIAESIQFRLMELFDLLSDDDETPVIGGVVVVPNSKKPADTDLVLEAITAASATAAQTGTRTSFHLVVGNRIQTV